VSTKRGLQGRVTKKLGLPLNERLRSLAMSRIEYGVESDYAVSFEISNPLGGFRVVTEEKFAAHLGDRNVGIFGEGSPVEALRLFRETYPDAGVFMRLDGKRRRKPRAPKSSRKRRTPKGRP
jgi:hypothetical protein